MAYQTPKTDWNEAYEPSPSDMNRIEGNIDSIVTENIGFSGDKVFSGEVTFADSGTVSGRLNQDVKTTDDVEFESVASGISLSKTATQRIGFTKTSITSQDITVKYPCVLRFGSNAVIGHSFGNQYGVYLKQYIYDSVVISKLYTLGYFNGTTYTQPGFTTVPVASSENTYNDLFLMPGTYKLEVLTSGAPSPAEIDVYIDIRSCFGTKDYTDVIT